MGLFAPIGSWWAELEARRAAARNKAEAERAVDLSEWRPWPPLEPRLRNECEHDAGVPVAGD